MASAREASQFFLNDTSVVIRFDVKRASCRSRSFWLSIIASVGDQSYQIKVLYKSALHSVVEYPGTRFPRNDAMSVFLAQHHTRRVCEHYTESATANAGRYRHWTTATTNQHREEPPLRPHQQIGTKYIRRSTTATAVIFARRRTRTPEITSQGNFNFILWKSPKILLK